MNATAGEQRSPPVGFCIYCHRTAEQCLLTDEHALPLALNGWLVLEKASCQNCAKITSRVEQFVLRQMLLQVRTHRNMKTRHKKNRPKTLPVKIKGQNNDSPIELPIDKHPLVVYLPSLQRAPYFSGESSPGWVAHRNPPFFFAYDAGRLAALGGPEKVSVPQTYGVSEFALFLAKVAYGMAIAFYGPKSFSSFVDEIIRTNSESASDFVGGCDEDPPFANRNTICHMHVRHDDEGLITFFISLFADMGAPYYEIAVGILHREVLRELR
jgi:hypothetical protein